MSERQYWADCCTKNCVWCFQVMYKKYGEDGCICGAFDHEEGEQTDKECECGIKIWNTEAIFLTREEAKNYGESRPYAWGKYKEGWRIYGVPAKGIMVNLIGQHNKEFEDKVEYITEFKRTGFEEEEKK